ncbi:MAG: S-layer homology domain-containing protein, partial [Clostridia bacterium]|nr:S-layer homology domain-containing protein [Clostridia bacterium]
KYGHEEGPLPDELFEQYGSWEEVIWKAFSANPGMDACLGLYDEYFDLYVASGMIDAEGETEASREYAAAALAEAFGLDGKTADADMAFGDGDRVSAWFADSVGAAASVGILRGYEDGSLRPDRAVTTLEAYVLLARCLGAEAYDGDLPDGVPAWAAAEIGFLLSEGVLTSADGIAWDEALTVERFGEMILAKAVLLA